ncbi:hypothetical protein L1049_027229 [Liquidambar formosana]
MDPEAVPASHACFALSGVVGMGRGCLLVLSDAENSVGMGFYSPALPRLRSSLDTYDCRARSDLPTPVGKARAPPASHRNATWLILPVVICLSQRLSHACVIKKLVVGPWVGTTGPPHGVHRSSRPFCRRFAPGLNWPGRASGAVTLKKLECSKQAYALDTLAWDNIIGFRSYSVGLRDRSND